MILASVQADANSAQMVVAAEVVKVQATVTPQLNQVQATLAPQLNQTEATVTPTTGTAPPAPPPITERFTSTGGQQVALSHLPAPGSLRVLVNGLEYLAGDWSLSGQTLTLIHPQTDPGDEITAIYQED